MTSRWPRTQPDQAVAAVVPFDDFVRQRSDRLVRSACLVTRDWEDARDAVQDALVSLYPRWADLPAAHLDGYVHRSVVNACLLRLRGRRRLQPVGTAGTDRASTALDPGDAVAQTDQVWRLCASLPPTQRAAVVLRFYGDLSYAEIGHALGCPGATARSHVHRALAQLRTLTTAEADHDRT